MSLQNRVRSTPIPYHYGAGVKFNATPKNPDPAAYVSLSVRVVYLDLWMGCPLIKLPLINCRFNESTNDFLVVLAEKFNFSYEFTS